MAAASLVALTVACSGGGDAHPEASDRPTSTTTIASTTTTAPQVGEPLKVIDQGVASYPDPFAPDDALAGYGILLENPNPHLMASGVRVVAHLLDAKGAELLVDRSVLNAVMPGQRMAVGRTLTESIKDPTQIAVTVEVSVWLTPAFAEGALTVRDIVTEPEGEDGSITRFTIQSTWPAAEDGVDVTAIYRAADGRILGAESATIALVAPGTDTPGQIRLLAPIPGLATTDVYVGRGLAAQTSG